MLLGEEATEVENRISAFGESRFAPYLQWNGLHQALTFGVVKRDIHVVLRPVYQLNYGNYGSRTVFSKVGED